MLNKNKPMLKKIKFRSLNIDITSALAKGEKLRSADALRQNLRAAELARVTVEKESKDLNALQEDLAIGQWPSIWARSQKTS